MKTLLVFIILSVLNISSSSAQQYATAELEEMGTLLKKKTIKHITLRDEKTQAITHLGIPIFSQNVGYPYDVIFRFIERYVLHTLLLGSVEGKMMLKDDKVEMVPEQIALQDSTMQVNIINDDSRFFVEWPNCKMSFPKNYSLISGLNKKESDVYFQKAVLAFAQNRAGETKDKKIDATVVRPETQEALVIEKGECYFINELNSDRYYVTVGDKKFPLYSENYASESVRNLMQTLVSSDIQLHISQNVYGYSKTYYTVPLEQFSNFCKEEGCKTYVGIESEDENEVKAIVVYRNELFSFNHMLYISVPRSVIRLQSGTIYGNLYCYIPTHNLKKLL